MIQIKPFSTNIIFSHKTFFVLDKLLKNLDQLKIEIKTPSGNEAVDFVDVFSLSDGTLLAAWEHPFQKLPLHNLIASDGVNKQIVNLYPLERIIDVYNRPVNSGLGAFVFAKSSEIKGGDWRCDRGMYGPVDFNFYVEEKVLDELNKILFYESFLNINGTAHIFYAQATHGEEIADKKINNSVIPFMGRTLQETIRIAYEWYVVSKDPFNSDEEPAIAAKDFFTSLDFSQEEFSSLEEMNTMQIGNYLLGKEDARLRPEVINELDEKIKMIVFKRMASSSLSALFKIHNLGDFSEILDLEKIELKNGIERFKKYYKLSIDQSMEDWESILNSVDNSEKSFVHNQLRFFYNKKSILNKIELDKL